AAAVSVRHETEPHVFRYTTRSVSNSRWERQGDGDKQASSARAWAAKSWARLRDRTLPWEFSSRTASPGHGPFGHSEGRAAARRDAGHPCVRRRGAWERGVIFWLPR